MLWWLVLHRLNRRCWTSCLGAQCRLGVRMHVETPTGLACLRGRVRFGDRGCGVGTPGQGLAAGEKGGLDPRWIWGACGVGTCASYGWL